MLNKEEKAEVMLSICDVNLDDVLSYVKDTLSNERHDNVTGFEKSSVQLRPGHPSLRALLAGSIMMTWQIESRALVTVITTN
jgi:hypothetical protein